MQPKRTILIAIILGLFGLSSQAQIQKNNWMVGGQASMNQEFRSGNAGSFTFSIAPMGGYFIDNRFLVGLKPQVSLRIGGNFTLDYFSIGGGILGRYYLINKTDKKGKLFLQITPSIVYHHEKSIFLQSGTIQEFDASVFELDSGIGFNYFIAPNIALEGILAYRFHRSELRQYDMFSNIYASLGFQVFLDGKRKSNK